MPTTRAPAAVAAALVETLIELPSDALGLVLYQLPLAHDIAAVAPTCHQLCDAAKLAMKARPFSGKVVTLTGHTGSVTCVAAAPDGRVVTGSDDYSGNGTIKVWRGGACVRTIHAHATVSAVAVLPGGARLVSGSGKALSSDGAAELFTFGGELERTFAVGSQVCCVAALLDGAHFVVGLGQGPNKGDVRLYHVDGTLVHAFTGHTYAVVTLAVTLDGQHIISGSFDKLFKVWSVAGKSLVSTCGGHTKGVRALAAMPDGHRILSGSEGSTVRVWLLAGTLENTFELHTNVVASKTHTDLVALPDNQHALSSVYSVSEYDSTITLFNVNDGTVLRTFKHYTTYVASLALLPDGLRFASVSSKSTARIVEHGLAPFSA